MSSRQSLADSDLADLIDFVTRVRSPLRLADYPSPVDLREILALPTNQARKRLWPDERGKIIGYGIAVDHFDNLRMLQVADSLGYVVEYTRAWYSKLHA
jgi:hypothetical protein